MENVVNELLVEAAKLKKSGFDVDAIRLALLERGLDQQGIERIISRLNPEVKKTRKINGLKLIGLGSIIVFISSILIWLFLFNSSLPVISLSIIVISGFFIVGVGIIKLL